MRWKNGGGATTEIAISPAGASLDDFAWRISAADVSASGPFSAFPGCDRVLVQTEGSPMTLSHGGHGRHMLALLVPHAFDGGWETAGEIGATSARDFNVIVRRSLARATVRVVVGEDEAPPASVRVVHALRGEVVVTCAGDVIALPAGDTLVVEDNATLHTRVAVDGAALSIAIERIAER